LVLLLGAVVGVGVLLVLEVFAAVPSFVGAGVVFVSSHFSVCASSA